MAVDVEKSVLRQGAVQHLYGCLSGTLHPDCSDAHLLVSLALGVGSGHHISEYGAAELCFLSRQAHLVLWKPASTYNLSQDAASCQQLQAVSTYCGDEHTAA